MTKIEAIMNKKNLRVLMLTAIILTVTALTPASLLVAQDRSSQAVAPAPLEYQEAIHQSIEFVEQMMDEQQIPGVSLAILVDGEIVFSEGFGYADLENRVPMWPHTKMRIGSVSKPITSVALARLYEAGILDLDAPIQQYVPNFPEKRFPITVKQVAGHLAGIRHYRNEEFLSSRRFGTIEEGLAIFRNDTLLFEPGSRYSYSSYGWNLISAVVEGASGTSFLDYMADHVFLTLGLRHTVADYTDSLIYHRTRYYEKDGNSRVINAPYVDNSYKWAGGGFLSTAEDLVRFGDAMINSDFLKPETVALFFASQTTTDGEETGYGIGWSSGTTEDGRYWVGHGGGSVGGTTAFTMYPDEKIVVAVICNMTDAGSSSLPHRIVQLLLENTEE